MLSLSLTCGYWENTWPLKSDRSRFESELAVSTLFDLGSSWKATLEDKTILCPATVSMFCGSVGKEDTLKGGGQVWQEPPKTLARAERGQFGCLLTSLAQESDLKIKC
ncbi:uncharacterized protein LOC144225508 isoform X2 [Crocuta crocuta]